MTTKVKLIVLSCLVVLFGTGALMLSTAWGAGEPEDPYWTVAGKRLESGSKKATIKNRAGVETILHSKIGSTEVEIKCKAAVLAEGIIEGSTAKHDGKASGVLELSECHLWAKEGEAFKEQTGCEVPSFKSGKLAGALWLEGTKVSGGSIAVLVFEPKELTEGKPLIAKVVVSKEGCAYKGTYALEGSFAARLLPQNEEFTYTVWNLPATAITTVWHPASEENEATIGLKLESKAASLQGELKPELESKEKFGGGTDPVAGTEAPFWGVNHGRLEGGEEKTTKGGIKEKEPTRIISKIKGKEVETKCTGDGFKEGKIIGSKPQEDGKFVAKTLEFTGCKILVMEGGKFKEQAACEVAPLATTKVSGRLYLEGTKEEGKMKPLLVLEPENLTGGKPVLAEETIKSKTGETCVVAEEKYKIEGAMPLRLNPENKEAKVVSLSAAAKSSTKVHQPAEQEEEREIKLEHEGEPIEQELPEIPEELEGGEEFGGGSSGVGEGKSVWEQFEGTTWKEVTNTEKVTGMGTLKLRDTKTLLGEAEIECGVSAKGTVAPGRFDRIAVVEVQASQCKAKKVCENVEEITAKNLPWQTEVYESGKEIRDNLKSGGSGEPGWRLKCKTLGGVKSDECLAEAGLVPSTLLTNKTSNNTVASGFEEKSTKTPKADCTEGGAKSGEVVGVIVLSEAESPFTGLRVS